MTVEQLAEALKPVIEDVVRKVMQSELREILTEAVEIASRPEGGDSNIFEIEDTPKPAAPRKLNLTKPDWVQELDNKEAEKQLKQTVQEVKKPERIGNGPTQEEYDKQQAAIFNLLGATAKGMTAEDMSNFG